MHHAEPVYRSLYDFYSTILMSPCQTSFSPLPFRYSSEHLTLLRCLPRLVYTHARALNPSRSSPQDAWERDSERSQIGISGTFRALLSYFLSQKNRYIFIRRHFHSFSYISTDNEIFPQLYNYTPCRSRSCYLLYSCGTLR